MREENFTLFEGYTDYLRRALGVALESNPCSEIELPKEKKSEKPNFKQTKK